MFGKTFSLSLILFIFDFIHVESFQRLTLASRFGTNSPFLKTTELKWALHEAAEKGDLQAVADVIENDPKMVSKIDIDGKCFTT